MKRTHLTRSAFAAVALLLLVATMAPAQEEIDRSLPAPADGTVSISNVSGSIRIEGWDEARVRVTGTLGEGTERLDFTSEERRTVVKVVLPRRARHVEGSDLVVRVPRGSRVEAEGVSAGIDAVGIAGELHLNTVSGEVTAGGDPRELRVQTVSGDITLDTTCDHVTAESVSGNVSIAGAGDDLEVSTVSGGAVLRVDRIRRLRFNSVSGGLECTGAPAAGASFQIESHSGNVELALPAKLSADFEISTFSGGIENAYGQKAKRTSKYAPGRELEFTVGGGGARFEITTFSGDVVLINR